jgi:hypothetical protein
MQIKFENHEIHRGLMVYYVKLVINHTRTVGRAMRALPISQQRKAYKKITAYVNIKGANLANIRTTSRLHRFYFPLAK